MHAQMKKLSLTICSEVQEIPSNAPLVGLRQILKKRIDMGLGFFPSIVYACFVLHNFCEIQNMTIEDDAVARQVACDRLQSEDAPDCLYSFNSAEGTHVRNITTQFYKEHIPH